MKNQEILESLEVKSPVLEMTISEFFAIATQGGIYEIETPNGFVEIGDLYKKTNKQCYSVDLENGLNLKASADHHIETMAENKRAKFFDNAYWIALKDIEVGDLVYTKYGPSLIKTKVNIGITDTFDLEVLDSEHKYFSNNIVSHNTGKTTIAEGIALKIVNKDIDDSFLKKRIIELNMLNVVSGTKFRGQFEERMKEILKEIAENPDVILFIDEFHNVVGAGNSAGALDASNIIKPALARGDLKVIASTTFSEYKQIIENDGALSRRFQKVMVYEPTHSETVEILKQISPKYEEFHKVSYSDEVLKQCVDMAGRFMTYRKNPDKSIDLMDEVGAKVKLLNLSKRPETITNIENKIDKALGVQLQAVKDQEFEKAAKAKEERNKLEQELKIEEDLWRAELKKRAPIPITLEDVAGIVAGHTGIPVNKLANSEYKQLLSLEEDLKKNLVGQPVAVEKVAQAIQRSRIGIQDPNRVQASFLLCGTSGVGKTELTKLLAKYLFHSEKNLIRLDMSEYVEPHSVSKMIGSPPGYVNHQEGGQLTEKVKNTPHSVVLFDEIEKAHPLVHNMLLQIMDEGKLTDASGTEVDFKNTIIIMTSNVGTSKIMNEKGVGFATGVENNTSISDVVLSEVEKHFKPEFINRIDEIVVFNSLTKENIREIVDIQLNLVIARLKKIDDYNVIVSDDVKDFLGKVGYDKKYGARPLKRAIINNVQNVISVAILKEQVQAGDMFELVMSEDGKKVVVKNG